MLETSISQPLGRHGSENLALHNQLYRLWSQSGVDTIIRDIYKRWMTPSVLTPSVSVSWRFICTVKCHVLVVYGLRYNHLRYKNKGTLPKKSPTDISLKERGKVRRSNKLLPVSHYFPENIITQLNSWIFLLYWGFLGQRGEVSVRILELSTAYNN